MGLDKDHHFCQPRKSERSGEDHRNPHFEQTTGSGKEASACFIHDSQCGNIDAMIIKKNENDSMPSLKVSNSNESSVREYLEDEQVYHHLTEVIWIQLECECLSNV